MAGCSSMVALAGAGRRCLASPSGRSTAASG